MKADTRTLREILRGDRCFEVPPYQRPYVWDEETQWEPLWADIETTACRLGDIRARARAEDEDVAKADRRAVPHFLGAIVVEQQPTAVGEVDVRFVVDGQQRLTTLQLVLRGILDALAALGVEGRPVSRLTQLVANDAEIVDGDAVFKVLPRPAEREAFFVAMSAQAPEPHLSVFAEARAYFAAAARSFLEDEQITPDPYAEGDELERRASLLVATMLSLLKLVVIDLDDVDDAQVIFEALNARSTPLSATDLVKNLFFMRAQRVTGDIQELYDAHWQRFDDDSRWWREPAGVGHAQRPRQDWLLGDWLIAETGRVISVGRLYSEFRRWLDESRTEVRAALVRLSDYADAYEKIMGQRPGASAREQLAFNRIQSLNITAAGPLLLWLLVQPAERVAPAERELAVLAIESFIIRRMAAKGQTRGYGQVFVEILRAARAAEDRAAVVVVDALKRSPGGYAWPSDADLRDAFRATRYYGPGGINQGRLRLLLGAIDTVLQAATPKTEPATFAYGSLTVEHVIPQKWRQYWPVTASDEPSRQLAEQRRDARVHSIGNLTLVTASLNPAMSNDPWSAKREELRKHSKLELNRLLCERDTWCEDDIEQRGEWLADQLERVWPGPGSARWHHRE